MVYIESAFWGDEKSTKNVTQVLNDRITGNKITVDKVDDSLIPAFTVAPKGELSKEDVRKIRERAQKLCGGPDQDCVRLRTSELTQEALRAKANDEITSGVADIIKGKRLTVNVRDQNGKLVRKVVPENGKFELDGLSAKTDGKPVPTMTTLREWFFSFVTTSIGAFVWVFGVVATYTIFSRMGWKYVAPILAFIAFIVPGSGYFFIIGYFGMKSFADTYVSLV
jgi:hypothetical protein